MTITDFYNMMSKAVIDTNKVNKVETKYSAELIDRVKRIVSIAEQPIFVEDYRVLSFAEIINAEEYLCVDFVAKQLLPVIDCGDNDFIVYSFADKMWMKFNIIDLCLFSKQQELEQIMK